MGKFLGSDEIEVEIFGEILPQEAVRILVRATLPGVIRICEVYDHTALLFNAFPIGKFRSVVECERPAFLFWDAAEPSDGQ